MPSYVLLERLPFIARHRGTDYHFRTSQITGSGNWRLIAEFAGARSWFLGETATETSMARMLQSTGIEARTGTIPAAILEDLVRAGRARVAGPVAATES